MVLTPEFALEILLLFIFISAALATFHLRKAAVVWPVVNYETGMSNTGEEFFSFLSWLVKLSHGQSLKLSQKSSTLRTENSHETKSNVIMPSTASSDSLGYDNTLRSTP